MHLDPEEGLQAWRTTLDPFAARTSDASRTEAEIREQRQEQHLADLAQKAVFEQDCGLGVARARIRIYAPSNSVREHQSKKYNRCFDTRCFDTRCFDTKRLDHLVELSQVTLLEILEKSRRVQTSLDGSKTVTFMRVQSLNRYMHSFQVVSRSLLVPVVIR
jgi:hypothetical protein